jgi:hypothetical protein
MQKTNDRATKTSEIIGGKFRFSGRVSRSCPMRGAHI